VPDDIDGYTNNSGNHVGVSKIQLSGLQYNGTGAPVQTMIPLPGSPAISAGQRRTRACADPQRRRTESCLAGRNLAFLCQMEMTGSDSLPGRSVFQAHSMVLRAASCHARRGEGRNWRLMETQAKHGN